MILREVITDSCHGVGKVAVMTTRELFDPFDKPPA
jgi:hypothetical protein